MIFPLILCENKTRIWQINKQNDKTVFQTDRNVRTRQTHSQNDMWVSGPAKQLAARLTILSWLPDIFFIYLFILKNKPVINNLEYNLWQSKPPQAIRSDSWGWLWVKCQDFYRFVCLYHVDCISSSVTMINHSFTLSNTHLASGATAAGSCRCSGRFVCGLLYFPAWVSPRFGRVSAPATTSWKLQQHHQALRLTAL